MITLNLNQGSEAVERYEDAAITLEQLERDVRRTVDGFAAILQHVKKRTCIVPTDLLGYAVTALMPPERMAVIGGRWVGDRFVLSALHDVTGMAHVAHVRADPQKLAAALINFEKTGAELAVWMHSHPGTGPGATAPSGIDLRQYDAWATDFGPRLIAMIVVRDRYVRLWGRALDEGHVRVDWAGGGVQAVGGHQRVYRLL